MCSTKRNMPLALEWWSRENISLTKNHVQTLTAQHLIKPLDRPQSLLYQPPEISNSLYLINTASWWTFDRRLLIIKLIFMLLMFLRTNQEIIWKFGPFHCFFAWFHIVCHRYASKKVHFTGFQHYLTFTFTSLSDSVVGEQFCKFATNRSCRQYLQISHSSNQVARRDATFGGNFCNFQQIWRTTWDFFSLLE